MVRRSSTFEVSPALLEGPGAPWGTPITIHYSVPSRQLRQRPTGGPAPLGGVDLADEQVQLTGECMDLLTEHAVVVEGNVAARRLAGSARSRSTTGLRDQLAGDVVNSG